MQTLKEIIVDFLKGKEGGIATLKECYEAVRNSEHGTTSDTIDCSTRAVFYNNREDFVRVCKGIYMLKGEKSTSLLIEGDGRTMSEIEDASVDCIITDHPWEDKANKGGNRHFADYETFRYTKEDFKQKARVLKDGAYLIEFFSVESSYNWKYLFEIKQMADECGLKYYTHCIWRNAPEGTINTGKTSKGVQQIVIFSKGKPRKLSPANVQGYQSKSILKYEIEMILRAKDRVHQAEKPVALYKYLIEQFTEEKDVCLDQFGGSCNMLQAAVDTNRFAVVYELCKDFVKNAANRFNLCPLYEKEEQTAKTFPEPLFYSVGEQLCMFA